MEDVPTWLTSVFRDDSPTRLLTGVLVALLVIYCLLRRWWFQTKYDWHKIPGPPMYPLLGHMPYYLTWEKPQTHLLVREWTKKYGSVIKMEGPTLGRNLWVSDPKYLQTHVTGHGQHGMPKVASVYEPFKKLHKYNRYSLFTTLTMTDYCKALRKGMAPAFSTESLKAVFPTMYQKAIELVQVVEKTPSKEAIDFQELLPRCTLDIVALSGFGIDYQSLQSEDAAFLNTLKIVGADVLADHFNPLRARIKKYLPFTKLAKESKRHFEELYSQVDETMEGLTPPAEVSATDKSLWGCLSRIKDPKTGKLLDNELLWGNYLLFLGAAYDTTAHQTAWALFCLAAHPDMQQKIRDEMQEKGLLTADGRPSMPSMGYEDIMSLQYITMSIKEASRLFPVGFGTTREVSKDGEVVCGYRVPKGVVIRHLPQVMHYLPWLWNEPDRFKPERFSKQCGDGKEAESGQESVTHVSKGTRKLWTFSDGPRDCIGQRMAMVTMQVLLAVLLARFKLRLADRMGGWDETVNRQYFGLVLSVDGGMWLHCDPL